MSLFVTIRSLGKFRFFIELDVIYNTLSNVEDQPNQWLDIIIRQTMEWHLPNDASLDLDSWATPLCLGHDKLAVKLDKLWRNRVHGQ